MAEYTAPNQNPPSVANASPSPNALCAIGKARYATTDARQYADYVVTDTPAPAPVPGKA
jgi:hypothetical protein